MALATGLDWVAAQKPAVINMSIAGPDGAVLRAAVERLFAAGIALVAAAGNQGPEAPPAYPAAYPHVLAVTAIDRELKPYAQANRGTYVALAAPGVAIWTSDPKGAGVFRDGTSFAAPFATAVLAQARAAAPQRALPEVLKDVESRARDLGAPGDDPVFGWGLVQAEACRTAKR
jgi:subtilisin family serine protease